MLNATSMKDIEAAKALAMTTAEQAFGAVHEAGGEKLCWNGRINRAMKMGRDAANVGNKEKVAELREGINALIDAAYKAEQDATKAASDYTAICLGVGVEVVDIPVRGQCRCSGCKTGEAHVVAFEARDRIRQTLFALLLPSDMGKMPRLVELVEAVGDEAKRSQLWQMVCDLAKAQKDYAEATSLLGENVNWSQILR